MSKLVGIIGAMDIEVDGLIDAMSDKDERICSDIRFVKGKICGKDAVVAKCGIGKVFAAMCAQTMILEYHPDIIINSGVAGTLTGGLSVMDAAVAEKVVQHDMDTSAIGDPKGLISGINKVYIDCDKRVVEFLKEASCAAGLKTVSGTLASGDQFVADKERKQFIASSFGAIDCEMEGGAIGQVCYVNSVPFGVIRIISDGDGAGMDYATFSKQAAENSIKTVKKFFEIYNQRGLL
ncbi:MAG: 5'-methylthioadenosine/adenosylhomocysteine nucleosidase [Eubacteriales bacterium]